MKPETIQLLRNLAIGISVLSLIGLGLWGAWHLVRLPMVTISQVVVTGGETISHQSIQTEVEQLLQGEYFNFVPRRFAYTYPQTEIVEQLTATPRVKDPQLSRTGRVLKVILAEFEPVALWCSDGQGSSSPCVFLDENGYGFAESPLLNGGSFARFVLVGESPAAGEVYTDSTDFADLRTLESLLKAYGWSVERIELDQARDAFLYLVGGGELKVTLRLTPDEIIDNLEAVLAAERYQHLVSGEFEYIDLRFGNKVFVNEFGAAEEPVLPEVVEDGDPAGLDIATTTLATPDED